MSNEMPGSIYNNLNHFIHRSSLKGARQSLRKKSKLLRFTGSDSYLMILEINIFVCVLCGQVMDFLVTWRLLSKIATC